MNKILNRTLLGLFAVSVSGFTTSCFGGPAGKKFVIFHTNDTHSRVQEGKDELGFAKISAIVNKERKDNENRTLYFDAGDTFHGKTFAILNKGESVKEIYDAMKVDAIAPGNHDFNYGIKRLLALDKTTGFPFLAANVLDRNKKNLFEPYKIFEKDGVKFGVFGLATPETLYKTHPKNVEGLTFENPDVAARKQVKALKAKEVDVIIGVGHIGNDAETIIKSKDVIAKVEGIDLFLDGHSHDASIDTVNGTLIVQTGEHTNNLGRVELFYDEKTKKISATAKLLKFDEYKSIAPDKAVETIIKKYEKINDDLTSDVVARTPFELNGERAIVRTQENQLGNLIASAIRQRSGADFALMNGGGIRETIPKGDITKKAVIEVLPFNNIVVKLEITGKVLVEMIEHGIRAYPESNGGFPNVAGMKVKFNDKNKVVSIVDDRGRTIENDKKYTLATNDFLASGGDDYEMLKGLKLVGEYSSLDDVLIKFMNSNNWQRYARKEGRIGPTK